MDTCHECINIVEKLNEEFDTLQDENTELKKIIQKFEHQINGLRLEYKYPGRCPCPSPAPGRCKYCYCHFKRKEFLERHVKICPAKPPPFDRAPVICEYCGKNVRKCDLLKHHRRCSMRNYGMNTVNANGITVMLDDMRPVDAAALVADIKKQEDEAASASAQQRVLADIESRKAEVPDPVEVERQQSLEAIMAKTSRSAVQDENIGLEKKIVVLEDRLKVFEKI